MGKKVSKAIKGYTNDQVILAHTIWMEARGEGARGMQAAGNVFLNRVAIAGNDSHYAKIWGKGIEGVATHWNRNSRGGKTYMFSAWNPRDRNYQQGQNANIYKPSFVTALRVSKGLIAGNYRDNTNGADHYYAPSSASPNWGNKGVTTARLGKHKFKNLTGIDGRKLRPTGRRMASNTTLKELFAKDKALPKGQERSPNASSSKSRKDLPHVIIHGDSHMQAVYDVNKRPDDYYTLDRAKNGAFATGNNAYKYPSGVGRGDNVIVGLGANDALASADINGFHSTLKKRVKWIQDKGGNVTLVGVQFDDDHKLHDRAAEYNKAISNVAFETGAKFLDVSEMGLKHKKDNVHFKNSEYKKIMGAALEAETPKRLLAIKNPSLAEQQIAGLTGAKENIPTPKFRDTIAAENEGSLEKAAANTKLPAIDDYADLKTSGNVAVPTSRPPLPEIAGVAETTLTDGSRIPEYRPEVFSKDISTDTGKQPEAAVSGKITGEFKAVTNYEFKPGESVSVYALRNGLNKDDIAAYAGKFASLNDLKTANLVIAGRTYKMPSVNVDKIGHQLKGEQSTSITYDIKKGDTLSGVFRKLGVANPLQSSLTYAKENGINPRTLEIGTQIKIGSDLTASSPTMH